MRSGKLLNWMMMGLLGGASVACGGGREPAQDAQDAQGTQDAQTAETGRVANVQETIERFKAKDPSMAQRFETAAGYFVVPSVGEGAFIVGGGHGTGEAFENGQYVGKVTVTELSVGAQVGGQSYSELVFFETPVDFARLRGGSYEINSEVTAVAADRGVAKNATFQNGTMAFVLPRKGLMASAAIAGQKITFTPAR